MSNQAEKNTGSKVAPQGVVLQVPDLKASSFSIDLSKVREQGSMMASEHGARGLKVDTAANSAEIKIAGPTFQLHEEVFQAAPQNVTFEASPPEAGSRDGTGRGSEKLGGTRSSAGSDQSTDSSSEFEIDLTPPPSIDRLGLTDQELSELGAAVHVAHDLLIDNSSSQPGEESLIVESDEDSSAAISQHSLEIHTWSDSSRAEGITTAAESSAANEGRGDKGNSGSGGATGGADGLGAAGQDGKAEAKQAAGGQDRASDSTAQLSQEVEKLKQQTELLQERVENLKQARDGLKNELERGRDEVSQAREDLRQAHRDLSNANAAHQKALDNAHKQTDTLREQKDKDKAEHRKELDAIKAENKERLEKLREENDDKLQAQQQHFEQQLRRIQDQATAQQEASNAQVAAAEERAQKAEARADKGSKPQEPPDEKAIAEQVDRIVKRDYSFVAKTELEPGVPLLAQFSKRDLRDWLGFADKHTDKIFRPEETQLKDEKIRLEALGKRDPAYKVKKAELERKTAALVRQKEAEKRSLFGDRVVTPGRVPGKWSERLNLALGVATNFGMLGSVYWISQQAVVAERQGLYCAGVAALGGIASWILQSYGDDVSNTKLVGDNSLFKDCKKEAPWGIKLVRTAELYQLVDHYHRKLPFTDSLSVASTASAWSLYNRTIGRVTGVAIRLYKRTLGHVVAPVIKTCTFGWVAPSNRITGMEALCDLTKHPKSVLYLKEEILKAGQIAARCHAYQEKTGKQHPLAGEYFKTIEPLEKLLEALKNRSALLRVLNSTVAYGTVTGVGIVAACGLFSGVPVAQAVTDFVAPIMSIVRAIPGIF